MLLNEFLKEHCKVEKLEAALEALTARLNEHDARIQQVSEQLEWKTPATRLAVSNR
jgi:prefoldin subunit 5